MSPRQQRLTVSALIGVAVGFCTIVGASWALATRAAEVVVGPHIAESKIRVRLMCVLARYQADSTEAVCLASKATCPKRPVELQPETLEHACD